VSLPDSIAAAALDKEVIKPVWFVYMDFLGDPARANSSGFNVTVSGSGDSELDGIYIGIDARFVSVGEVRSSSGGGDTVTCKLSGIRGLDDEDRLMLGDPANWQGRTARLWRMIRDEFNVQQGAIQAYYTGYMQTLGHMGSGEELTLELSIEGYLAAFSDPSNRTYMSQELFDPGDHSAQAAIATANGQTSTTMLTAPPSIQSTNPFGPGFDPTMGGTWSP